MILYYKIEPFFFEFEDLCGINWRLYDSYFHNIKTEFPSQVKHFNEIIQEIGCK